jgi:hypothetical protein
MKTRLREGPVYGMLPILYVFLARTGKTIHEVNFVSLDEQGKLIADELLATKRNAASGVKIVFSDGERARSRRFTTSAPTSQRAHFNGAVFRRS